MQQTAKNASVALLLTLMTVCIVASLVDVPYYLAYCQRVGVGLLGIFNPLRMLRYMVTPIGALLRVAIFSPILYIALAWWIVAKSRTATHQRGAR